MNLLLRDWATEQVVIGEQRCGTSSLYKYLCQHPEVTGSICRETRYFTSFFDYGEEWYRAHFPLTGPLAGGRKVCFEAAPDYLLDPRAAERRPPHWAISA